MGAHGTCEEALLNVAAFSAADATEEAATKSHKKKGGSKDKKQSKHKEAKHARKEGKHKEKEKHKRHKKKRRRESASDDESDSDSQEGAPLDLQAQLARGRAAARATREVLVHHADLRKDLRQLLWRVDQGEAVDLSGIPDAPLRGRLTAIFDNLPLRRTQKGVYIKGAGASPVLTLLGPVLQETPAQLASAVGPASAPSAPQQSTQTRPQPAAAPAAAADGAPAAAPTAANGHLEPQQERPGSEDADALQEGLLGDDASDSGTEELQPLGRETDAGPDVMPAAAKDIGPAAGPSENHAHPTETADARAPHANGLGVVEANGGGLQAAGVMSGEAQEGGGGGDEIEAPRSRVAGPAMPPPELLEAAQEAAVAMRAQQEAEEAEELVGPAPAELEAELADIPDNARSAEVARILAILATAAAGPDGAPLPDAYDVLGLEAAVAPGDVKKRYWRLSLMVHPDKCPHPGANEAFQALSKAAKELQDPGKRSAVDARREDAALMRAAVAAAEEQERARQWRVARGTATAEDLKGPIRPPQPVQRGAWMTELPEYVRARQPSQVNVNVFSQQGIQERGDTRDWTETPAQKLMRLTAAAAEQPAALPCPAASSVDTATAAAVDAYNSQARRKTLLEVHQGKLKAEKKQKKKRKAEAAAAGAAAKEDSSWEGSHPWRPFDREKDLNVGPAPQSKEALLQKAGASLSTRFGGGGSAGDGRSFL